MKTIQHTFDGQVYTLEYGRLWAQKFFKDATGKDPLDAQVISAMASGDIQSVFSYLTGLVYSGINAYKMRVKEEIISIETAQNFVGLMDDQEMVDFANKYADAVRPKEPGEANPQPESPSVGTN